MFSFTGLESVSNVIFLDWLRGICSLAGMLRVSVSGLPGLGLGKIVSVYDSNNILFLNKGPVNRLGYWDYKGFQFG